MTGAGRVDGRPGAAMGPGMAGPGMAGRDVAMPHGLLGGGAAVAGVRIRGAVVRIVTACLGPAGGRSAAGLMAGGAS